VSPARSAAHPEIVSEQIPRGQKGWITLATSADHKSVGRMYVATAMLFATAALAELLMMRLQLIVPENSLIRPEIFDRLLSAYGVTALLLFALPLAIGLLSIVVPLQIGARGMALPRLHHLSYWLYLFGGVTIYASFLYRPSEAGIIGLPPLSSSEFLHGGAVDAWITGIALVLLGLVCFSVSMVATLKNFRAPGMALQRMPMFAWAGSVVSYTLLIVSPVFLAALVMLMIDRHYGGVFFVPGEGGKPLVYEHIASIFLAGAFASVIVTAFGAISEILATFARQPQFGHRTVAGSFVAFAVLSVLGWMSSMYSAPVPTGFLYFAMFMTLAAIVPVGLIIFNWIGTLGGGSVRGGMPLKYALGAIVLLVIGLVGKLIQAVVPVGWLLTGTAFTSGTTFALVAGAGVLGGFAALYYWFPKLCGRTMGDALGTASYWALMLGALLMTVTMIMAGLQGMPVDVYKFYEDTGLSTLNLLTSIGAIVFIIGFVITMINAAASYKNGVEVGPDPWRGSTLEWFTPSPPPVHNFDLIPDVRSAEPLEDMRDAISRRATRWYPPVVSAAQPDPDPGPVQVAEPATPVAVGADTPEGAVEAPAESATTQDEDDSPVA
jgi:heme/copper-type cytochrome/quinol oxidase subunit 1